MNWKKLIKSGPLLAILIFPFIVYEAFKSIHLITNNKLRYPLLNQLLNIRWDIFLNLFGVMFVEGIEILLVFLVPYMLWNVLRGRQIISKNAILLSFAVALAFALLISTIASMNQTQLDIVVGFLAIFALVRPIIFSKKVTALVDYFLK